MDTTALERLDVWPYRHRVSELMSAPVVTFDAARPVAEAARTMADRRISSVVVLGSDGRPGGILTERDVLRLVAAGRSVETLPVAEIMSAPVQAIEADALVYRALARMARLGVRHLPVVDAEGRPVGMLTSSALLRQRATLALTLGDEVATASDAAALRATHDRLPALARGLLAEKVEAAEIAAVIAGITRDLTARAGELALAVMSAAGRGPPPGKWCLLVLGSAGRGESLMVPDQDNALILDDAITDDSWFAEFGQRLNELLDQAGVPLCAGGVMAGRPDYRRTLSGWRARIDDWIARPSPKSLLGADIFLDFVPVLGDAGLAGALRAHATQQAADAPMFLRLLAEGGAQAGSATDLLGRFRLRDGRLDLKLHGLLPIVSGARALALGWRVADRSTDRRLAQTAAAGGLPEAIAHRLQETRETFIELLLRQQLADLSAGRAPGNAVDPAGLKRAGTQRLRRALGIAAEVPEILRDALSDRPLGRTERPPVA